jgi:hypothetical protein
MTRRFDVPARSATSAKLAPARSSANQACANATFRTRVSSRREDRLSRMSFVSTPRRR